jgi:predicted RNA-binding Zn ribbon-like protein
LLFAYDTDLNLRHAAALVNTAPGRGVSGVEDLPDVDAVLAWMEEWGWTGARPTSAAEVAALHRVRGRVDRLWQAPVEEQVAEVNALLAAGRAVPRLVEHDDVGWHIHATDDDAPLAERFAVEVAMALVDVIRADERERLSRCSAEDCDDVYVDLSRNRSRKFCDGTCGTRANVAAYRARKAAGD